MMIHYRDLTLGKLIWNIDPMTLEVKANNIRLMELNLKFNGRTEEIIYNKSTLKIQFTNDVTQYFNLNNHGKIITDDTEYYFESVIAIEESIIKRTKQSHE